MSRSKHKTDGPSPTCIRAKRTRSDVASERHDLEQGRKAGGFQTHSEIARLRGFRTPSLERNIAWISHS
jgi:hypothetical protein